MVAGIGLTVLLGTLAAMILRSQEQSRAHLQSNFRLRASTSATLIGTYLTQQAQREKATGERFLSDPAVSQARFETVASAFGSHAAVLLDATGAVLDVVPYERSLIGRRIANGYAHLRAAETGTVAISNVVPSAAQHEAVTAIAVPVQTPIVGRRVFSAAYGVDGGELQAFVEHVSTTPGHKVVLIDGAGQILAASPATTATTVGRADPALARAMSHGQTGAVPGSSVPSTFAETSVPGTPWRLAVMAPDRSLFASIGGLTRLVPWLIFALVSLLGGLLLALFARSLADRTRLSLLSAELEAVARTDPLTGLLNRRGFDEHVTRVAAHARRHGQPMSFLMIDLDRFKQVNDHHGHDAGDRVLCALADCLRDVLRAEDVYARLGGDEFVVAMTATDEGAAVIASQRLRRAASAVDLGDIGLERGIAMSIGFATGIHTTIDDLLRAADVELYRVKNARPPTDRSAAGAASQLT
jgi:diguanylate cyclase (GGDEF)-like protein